MLFPSASKCKDDDTEEEVKTRGTDWLENKSFTSETAKKVKEFQKELNELQRKIGLDEETDGFDTRSTIKEDKTVEQDHVVSETTSSSQSQKSKKKKKKRKHEDYDSSSSFDDERHKHDYSDDWDKDNERKGHRYKDEEEKHERKKTEKAYKSESKHHKDKKKKRRHQSSDSDEDIYRRKKKNKHASKHKKHTKEKSLTPDVDKRPEVFTSNAVFLEDLTVDIYPENAYRVDRKADKNSWTYGSLYKQHIAQYKPFCHKCMGTRKGENFLVKDKGKNKRGTSLRYFDKENRKVVKQSPIEIITKNSKEPDPKGHSAKSDNVIHIEVASRDNLHDRNEDIRDKLLDPSTALYVQGKSGVGVNNDALDTDSVPVLTATRTKTAMFNRQLQEKPDDIQLWLDFVKYQDIVFQEEESFGSKTGGPEGKFTKAVIEKKISIVEKALVANPGNIDLMLHKLELTSDLVDAAKINKELEQLLFVHSANTRLWRYYLRFNQSKISLFSVSRMIKLYHKCFKILLAILEGKVVTHTVPENLCKEILDLVIEYCYFLKQAGHREKATGTLQAIVEYNILCPSAMKNVTKETKMATFEEFWDCECSRVGNVGAVGWNVWYDKKVSGQGQCHTDSLEEIEEGIIEKKFPRWKSWLEIETVRETHHMFPWLPGEGQTDEDCEDADSMVVFDDVSSVLFEIPSNLYLDLLFAMVALDQDINCFNFLQQFASFRSVFEHISEVPNLSCSHLPHLEAVSKNDFATKLLDHVIPIFTDDERTILTLLYIDVNLKKFQKSQGLSLLNKSEKKELRRILKTVLKQEQNRSNLFIWAAYIQIERQMGKQEEYQSIAETAVAMHSGAPVKWFINDNTDSKKRKEKFVCGLINVFVQYIEILLGMDSDLLQLLPRSSRITMETKSKVQYVISCLLDGKKVDIKNSSVIPGASVLRISAKFPNCVNAIIEELNNSCDTSALIETELLGLCWCYSLFSYCSNGIQSGLDVFTQVLQLLHSTKISNGNDLEERLLESKMRLIVFHMSVSASPLHILREHLDEALLKFPENSTFLTLFINVEKKARISGRINKHFDKQSRFGKDPLPVVFAVCDLISQASDESDVSAAGESVRDTSGMWNRARSWLENYLHQASTVQCPLVWRIYMQLELLCDRNASRCKGLFYRAIQQCPWNKNLYKDGIRVLGEEKLQEIVDLMIEKELRVHLPVEELDILME